MNFTIPTASEYFSDILSRDLGLQCKYAFGRLIGNRLYSRFTDDYLEYKPQFIACKAGKRNRTFTYILTNKFQ